MMLTSSVFVFPTNAFNAWAAALDDDETKHQKLITNQVFFEFAIDGTKIGRVVVGVYGNESITARRFLALSKGIQGLSYRRKPIIGIEENEDETVETPLWITSSAIAKFEAPGTGEAINTPNGTSFSITYAPSEDLDVTNVVVGEVISGFDVLAQIGSLPTVPDNSDSPFFQVAKSIGDKRALVSEKSFGKPFAKVTLLNCGEVASTEPGEEVKSEDGAGEEQSSQ
ncbi:unnamed protein product [Bathycoccus prasinos]